MPDKPQHVISLEAKDTLCLKAISLQLDGKPMIIGGQNGSGKSAALQVVRMLVAGAKEIPDNVVRHGAKKSETKIETEDYIISRTIEASGKQRFELVEREGGKVTKPQTFLDSMRGKTTFDPQAFARADKHEQRRIMKELAGVDTDEVDARLRTLESGRTDLTRDVKRAQGAMDSSTFHAGAPEQETSVSELSQQLQEGVGCNAANADERRKLETLRADSVKLTEQIAEASKALAELQARRDDVVAAGKSLAPDVKALEDVDLEALRSQLGAIEETNKHARDNADHKRLVADWEKLADEHQNISEKIDAARAERHAMVEAADFPIDGLGFDDDGVTYNGLPFSAASKGESMRVSTAIGIAEAKKQNLAVMLIDDAENLDDDNLRAVLEMAAEAGIQPVIARRGEGATVTLEDGEVAD